MRGVRVIVSRRLLRSFVVVYVVLPMALFFDAVTNAKFRNHYYENEENTNPVTECFKKRNQNW